MLDVAFFTAIDHVQLAMPAGEEDRAREFYTGVLRMTEIPKPPELAKRGGVWFASGIVQIHLGVEQDFRRAKKAHPALRSDRVEDLLAHLAAHNIEVTPDDAVPGTCRFYVADYFGNRLEIIAV
jgi:catechol 2,3-dioxygenase-like lactoylglutathione lyase family enzyme